MTLEMTKMVMTANGTCNNDDADANSAANDEDGGVTLIILMMKLRVIA